MPFRAEKEFPGPYAVPFYLGGFAACERKETLAKLTGSLPPKTVVRAQRELTRFFCAWGSMRDVRVYLAGSLAALGEYLTERRVLTQFCREVATGEVTPKKPYRGYVRYPGPQKRTGEEERGWAEFLAWPGLLVVDKPKREIAPYLFPRSLIAGGVTFKRPEVNRTLSDLRSACSVLARDLGVPSGDSFEMPVWISRQVDCGRGKQLLCEGWAETWFRFHGFDVTRADALAYLPDYWRVVQFLPLSVPEIDRLEAAAGEFGWEAPRPAREGKLVALRAARSRKAGAEVQAEKPEGGGAVASLVDRLRRH